MSKKLHIRWAAEKETQRPFVRKLKFCCPATAENWNRVTQFKYHPMSQDMEVVNRAQVSAATLQAAAVGHAAAVTVEEATGMSDADLDCEDSVDFSLVFPWNFCPHCGATIEILQSGKVHSEPT